VFISLLESVTTPISIFLFIYATELYCLQHALDDIDEVLLAQQFESANTEFWNIKKETKVPPQGCHLL
jgi:hypothetical protein